MKSLKLLWMLSVVCMVFASCQQVLEPINTVPVVTTGEASYIKATSVVLHGEYQGAGHSSEYYRFFLLSTQKDFADVDPRYIDENEIKIDGLQPNTTYYYAFGVAENYDFRNCQKVVGEIKSFTTSEGVDVLKTEVFGTSGTRHANLRGAYKGTLENPDVYFKISTHDDLSDAFIVLAEKVKANDDGSIMYIASTSDLNENTTYYVAFCIKIGSTEMQGNILKGTTDKALHIGRVTLVDWDGKEVDFPLNELGFDGASNDLPNYCRNYHIVRTDGVWKIENGNDLAADYKEITLRAYAPYQASYVDKNTLPVYQTHEYNPDMADVLWGTVTSSESTIDIKMKHISSRVIFHFNILKDSSLDELNSKVLSIRNIENSVILWTVGKLNLYDGYFSTIEYEPLNYYKNLKISKGLDTDLIIYSIPNFTKGEVELSLDTDYGTIKVPFTILWESGKTYEYKVSITANTDKIPTMTIEDVTKY